MTNWLKDSVEHIWLICSEPSQDHSQVLKWPPNSRPERAATSTSPLGVPCDGVCEAPALEIERGRCAGSACRIKPPCAAGIPNTVLAQRRWIQHLGEWPGWACDGTWPSRHPQRTFHQSYGGTSRPRVLAHPGGAPAPPGHSIYFLCSSDGLSALREKYFHGDRAAPAAQRKGSHSRPSFIRFMTE